jgi:hypothetical protein
MKPSSVERSLQHYLAGAGTGLLFVAVILWLRGEPLQIVAPLALAGVAFLLLRKRLGVYPLILLVVLILTSIVLNWGAMVWQKLVILGLAIVSLAYDIWVYLAKIPRDEYRERLEARGSEFASLLVVVLAALMLVQSAESQKEFFGGLLFGALAVRALSRVYAWWGLRR